jgi:GDPmannose 4,6-dehydratase
MRRALVLGANGQDGRFLVRSLLARGYEVVGAGRQPGPAEAPHPRFGYRRLDLVEATATLRLAEECAPDMVFHAAAVHGPAGFAYEATYDRLLAVNAQSLHAVLEYARGSARPVPVVYLSSAKVFGHPLPATVSEASPRGGHCLYSISKVAADSLVAQYRRAYGVPASSLWLFNHESEFRPASFFIPRVVAALAAALGGARERASVQSLDFHCDWGDAAEFMDITVDVAERAAGQDFVLASGRTWRARDMVDALFRRHGLDRRDHLEALAPEGPAPHPHAVSLARLADALGRRPEIGILDLCDRMLAALPATGTAEGQGASA